MIQSNKINLIKCGSETHLSDVASLRNKGFALPHQYVSWCIQSQPDTWKWCRVINENDQLITGFAIQIQNSGAMPGAKLARIEKFGRGLHAQPGIDTGGVLLKSAKAIPRLERLVVEICDEDEGRRKSLIRSIELAGAQRRPLSRQYRYTLFVDLLESDEQLLASFSQSLRRDIVATQKKSGRVQAVKDLQYSGRIKFLLGESFHRTGGTPPWVDTDAMIRDAAEGRESILMGVFWPGRSSPEDLVAFAWGRLNGDSVSYDVGASERSEDIGRTPLAYILFWEIFRWARQRKALWVDLGGVIASDVSPDHALYGISAFKRRFSKDERTVGAELWFEPVNFFSIIGKTNRWIARVPKLIKAKQIGGL